MPPTDCWPRETGGIEHYPKSRPVSSEVSATARAVAFAELTQAPSYIVHLSSAGALEEVRRGRSRFPSLWIETRPLYLHLTEERFLEPDGAKYVGQPPLRTKTDVEAIWRGLAAGEIDTVCTDHAAWRYEDKVQPGLTVATVRPGVADLETQLPMLFSEGRRKGPDHASTVCRRFRDQRRQTLRSLPAKGNDCRRFRCRHRHLGPGANQTRSRRRTILKCRLLTVRRLGSHRLAGHHDQSRRSHLRGRQGHRAGGARAATTTRADTRGWRTCLRPHLRAEWARGKYPVPTQRVPIH